MKRESKRKYPGLTLLGNSRAGVPKSPGKSTLEMFANPRPQRDYSIRIDSANFTSLCPVTGQPDFAEITVEYIPNERCLETKSLKLYLASYRDVAAFNEEVVNRILDDLVRACQPRRMRVEGRFSSRGGLALTVTASYPQDSAPTGSSARD